MLILHCQDKNEMVAIAKNTPGLMINIYDQEDGMLINLSTADHNVEALVKGKRACIALYNDLLAGTVEVDDIFVGAPTGTGDEDEEDEDLDD